MEDKVKLYESPKPWGKLFILLGFLAVVAAATYLVKETNLFNKDKGNDQIEEFSWSNPDITVDQRLDFILFDKYEYQAEKLVHQLERSVIRAILERIGANVSYLDIANEYRMNTELYISHSVLDQLPEIELRGPDADRVSSIKVITELDALPVEVPIKKQLQPGDSIR